MSTTKESIKYDVNHFFPLSHLSHFGSGKEVKWLSNHFLSEESASEFVCSCTLGSAILFVTFHISSDLDQERKSK